MISMDLDDLYAFRKELNIAISIAEKMNARSKETLDRLNSLDIPAEIKEKILLVLEDAL